MNTANLTLTLSDETSIEGQNKTKGLIVRLFNAIKTWNDGIKHRAALAKMNPHLLRDMGIDRPQIQDIGVDRRWMP